MNQTKSRHANEENDTPVDIEPKEVLFNISDVPIPRKALETKIQKRQRGKEGIERELALNQKGKDIDSLQSKSKREGGIYPTSEFLKNSTQSMWEYPEWKAYD